jgi:catechol 2,3-dioxygenase-like lactoylglutathione lyase family enzyme
MTTETILRHGSSGEGKASAVSPHKLAHVVLRTSRYKEMIEWYKTMLYADIAYSDDLLTFLSYDEEHHRVALLHVPGLIDHDGPSPGVHHFAFTFESLGGLLSTYERVRDLGIKPVFVINHGPTTSLYYEDPDRNSVEFQIDNIDDVVEAGKFFYSKEFAENPVGVEFDPEDLVRRYKAGEPEAELKKRPNVGPRGLDDIKLR